MSTIRLNLSNNAPTQYTNYNFTSMIEFNGVLLGAGSTGLHKICCGTDDNGTSIAAYFIPATSDFGMGQKRIRYAYFDFECNGDMKISLTGDGKTTIGPYTVDALLDEGAQERRVSFGRGLKWKYGKFKVENVSGAGFSIDRINLVLQEVGGRK